MSIGSMQRRLCLLTTIAICLATGSPGSAAEPGERDQRRVERIVELQPLRSAEVLVSGFKAIFLSDGSVTLSGKGSAKVGSPQSGFDFEVDLVQETYTTRRLKPGEIGERAPLQQSSGFNRAPVLDSQSSKPPLSLITAAVSPGSWHGRVRVQTKDPAFLILTETNVELTWTVYSNGTVAWSSYSDGCWAANPSALGTHWFVSSCATGGPYYTSSTRVCNDHAGSYYNYDFLDASQRTDVSDSDWLCGRNDAMFDYNWSHNDSGEASLLIYGSVVVN